MLFKSSNVSHFCSVKLLDRSVQYGSRGGIGNLRISDQTLQYLKATRKRSFGHALFGELPSSERIENSSCAFPQGLGNRLRGVQKESSAFCPSRLEISTWHSPHCSSRKGVTSMLYVGCNAIDAVPSTASAKAHMTTADMRATVTCMLLRWPGCRVIRHCINDILHTMLHNLLSKSRCCSVFMTTC